MMSCAYGSQNTDERTLMLIIPSLPNSADYFQARRELEEAYLKALSRISKRSFLSDASSIPSSFAPVYERLVREIDEVARVHGDLEHAIANQCEDAVRQASNRGAWANVREYDDRLGNTLKELNSLETQLGKDAKKLDSASEKKLGAAQQKVGETQKAIDETFALWTQDGQRAFVVYQKIDKERLDLLKEVVTRFETANADAAQSLMRISEQTMQVCLSFDVDAEMQEFALKEGSATGAVSRASGRNAAGAGTGADKPAVPSRLHRSASNATQRTTGTLGGGAPAASGRKSEMPPPPLPASRATGPTSGLPSSSSSNLASTDFGPTFSNNSNNNTTNNTYNNRGDDATSSIHSGRDNNIGDSSFVSTATKGSTFKSAFSRFGRTRSANKNEKAGESYAAMGSGGGDMDSFDGNATLKRPTTNEARRGGMLDDDDFAPVSIPGASSSSTSGGPPRLPDPMQPSRAGNAPSSFMNGSSTMASPPATGSTPAPQVDAEGYSIPPPDRKPWEMGAPGGPSDLMDDDEENDVLANL